MKPRSWSPAADERGKNSRAGGLSAPGPAPFVDAYAAAMEKYLASPGEQGLALAYELGRDALRQEMGVLGVATAQIGALVRVLQRRTDPAACVECVKELEGFLIEMLSSYEMTHRGIREANRALRRLNQSLEDEARRIAHAIHDESSQLLAAVHIALGELSRELPPPSRERLHHVRQLLTQAEQQLRRLSHELRPTILDDLGLVPALEFLARGISERTRLRIRIDHSPGKRFPREIELILYRIVQEALTNVSKHARASWVRVRLRRLSRAIQCSIRDDGVGFDPDRRRGPGLGFPGMRERLRPVGGVLEISSAKGRGTELLVSIPLKGLE